MALTVDGLADPEYQGIGAGGSLVERILYYDREHTPKEETRRMNLLAAAGKEGSYQKFGFGNTSRTLRRGRDGTLDAAGGKERGNA